jgi:hypothetical protein
MSWCNFRNNMLFYTLMESLEHSKI